ncbi:MAG: hypothetical protein J3R72DRAFT_454276 [Linnemannia gamsii]|nr:MAG: hypothetical protein J3R72DRAFT_454276 [Linnemannia gamsii]
MGQRVVLETPAPEITAAANKHKVKTISQLQLGDRIKAEGLMAIECKIKKDKRNKPRASMWLSFKIQKEWTFLGNPIDYEEDNDSDDSAGDSNMSESSDGESSDSDDDTHKADGSNKGDLGSTRLVKNEKKREREVEPRTHRKRVRSTTFMDPADGISVKFRADCFDYLSTDEKHRKKGETDNGKISALRSSEGKQKDYDRDEEKTHNTRTKPSTTTKTATRVPPAPTPTLSSEVDTNASAKVVRTDAKTITRIRTKTVLTTAAAPSVHAVTAAAAMAMTNSVSKTMATIKK